MSRCDQFAGLPNEAVEFLNENLLPPITCPTCNCIRPFKTEVVGHFSGMFGDQYDLSRHQLKDGGWADEFVQASPWSSGPVFFLGLRTNTGQVFLWPQETIENE